MMGASLYLLMQQKNNQKEALETKVNQLAQSLKESVNGKPIIEAISSLKYQVKPIKALLRKSQLHLMQGAEV